MAASEHSQNNKYYEQLSVIVLPKNSGEMTNWVYSLGTATVVSGCFGDNLEADSFDELDDSDMDGVHDQFRWKRFLNLSSLPCVTMTDKI